jgi:4-amino-4-deoxy-L-arabinose transferase-like glycosyltransferase
MLELLAYPFPHDGLEGTLLHEARLLWAGQPLYQPLEPLRFVSAPYPPLHPLVLGLADQFAGPHLFWSGRLISLVGALGVAVLVAVLIRRVAGSWLAGLIGVALFLSAPPVVLWATRIKPDMLALLFTALGLCLAAQAFAAEEEVHPSDAQRSNAPRWAWVAVCFVLAGYTKQTAVAAPLGVGLALLFADLRAWWQGERAALLGRLPLSRRTLLYGITYAVLMLGIWALLDIVTRGQYTAHVWGLHRGEWWSPHLLRKFVELLARWSPAALLGLLLLPRAGSGQRWLPLLGYLIVVPISLLGAGETGANHNHLIESHLALALAAGCAAGWAATLPLRRWPAIGLVCALLVTQIVLAYTPPSWYRGELAPRGTPARYLDFIRSQPGEVLADDVALLLQAGRPLRYDDPSTMGPAAQSGVWDQSGLLREIAEQRFSAILIPTDVGRDAIDPTGRWTPQMLAAIRAHYRVLFRDTIMVYVPKS